MGLLGAVHILSIKSRDFDFLSRKEEEENEECLDAVEICSFDCERPVFSGRPDKSVHPDSSSVHPVVSSVHPYESLVCQDFHPEGSCGVLQRFVVDV